MVLNISLQNPLEVILAICFTFVAFAALLATFATAIAYVYSNIIERWAEYSKKKRLQVVRNVCLTGAVIVALAWLSSNRL